MNLYLKFLINVLIILIGIGITCWAGFKWSETGFVFSSPFRTHDGNAFFYILLIGIAIIAYGTFESSDYLNDIKEQYHKKKGNNLKL